MALCIELAIQSGNEKQLQDCLKKIEELGPWTPQDVKKHVNFIISNKKDLTRSYETMLNYFSKKQGCRECVELLENISSNSEFHLIGAKKEGGKTEDETFVKTILGSTLSCLQPHIETLPPSNVSNFLMWIFDSKNPLSKDYLQLTSITNTIQLEIKQFGQLISGDVLLEALSKLGMLNAYFFTEVFSDHLAMGLADPTQESTKEYQLKLSALRKVNEMTIAMLNDKKSKEDILPQDFEKFSIYQQCLAPEEMQKLVSVYQDQHKDSSGIQTDLEYSFFPMIKLNIEACRAVLKSLTESKLYPLFKKGLIARYSAVNTLLSDYKKLTLDESLAIGKQTILVAPTLAYCIAALDQVKPNPKLEKVIKDHSLEAALDSAALLVRLLNDIGTIPLSNPTESLEKLKLCVESSQNKGEFLTHLKLAPEEWSRIVKDLTFGEHNVSLDSIRGITDESAWQQFKSNILYLSKIYQQQKKELIEAIKKIDEKIEDKIPGQLILNFVSFHEKLYSKNAQTSEGEYAISKSH